MITLANFAPTPRTESVPLDATRPILHNWPLVVMMVREAFAQKPERVVLLLTSNGNEDRMATEWYLRRVVS